MSADPWSEIMAAHERSLKPGVRVRISLGGECSHHGDPSFSQSKHSLTNGLTGVILSRSDIYPNDPFYGTHQFMVRYEGGPFYSGCYAAAELIPITAQEWARPYTELQTAPATFPPDD